MSVNPAGTKWTVAGFDNEGKVGSYDSSPWEFNEVSMNSSSWAGGYRPIPGSDSSYVCEIVFANKPDPGDKFEVHFVTPTRFIGTKGGGLYRFGKKL